MEAKLALVKTYISDSQREGTDIVHNYLSTQLNIKRIIRKEIIAYQDGRVRYTARTSLSQSDGLDLAEADLNRIADDWKLWLQNSKKISKYTHETVVSWRDSINAAGSILVIETHQPVVIPNLPELEIVANEAQNII